MKQGPLIVSMAVLYEIYQHCHFGALAVTEGIASKRLPVTAQNVSGDLDTLLKCVVKQ